MPVLEAIEQVAAHQDVAVDARVVARALCRHALELLLEQEIVDRVVVPASSDGLGRRATIWCGCWRRRPPRW